MPLFPPTIAASSAASSASSIYVNAKDAPFNAKGDGSTVNTAAIQAAINSLNGPGAVYLPPGTYMSNTLTFPYDGIRLLGAGKKATALKKASNCDLIDLSGTAAGNANHRKYCSIEGMTLDGNNKTGKLLRVYYSSLHRFDSILFYANNDMAVESAEFWDSYFTDCFWDFCGDTAGTVPSVYLKNAAATVGNFGYSTDNTNMIWFINCHWEDFYKGALYVDGLNGNTNNPNGIYLVNCKMESNIIMGTFLNIAGPVKGFHAVNLYIAGDSFKSGYSTAIPAIGCYPANECSLENVLIGASASVFSSGIDIWPGTSADILLKSITYTGTAPTNGVVQFSGNNTAKIGLENISTEAGTLYSNQIGSSLVYPFRNYDHIVHQPSFASPYTPDLLNNGDTVIINPVTAALTLNAPSMLWIGAKLTFILTSNATGNFALTWNGVYKANQTALPTTMPGPNLTISVSFVSDGTNWYRVS